MYVSRMAHHFQWTWALALIVVCFSTTTATMADSDIVIPADGYMAVDFLPGEFPNMFCAFGDDVAIFTNTGELQIVNHDNPASRQSWGQPTAYANDFWLYGSFIVPDPSGTSLWVGFTVDDSVDDRIYQVDASGWTYRATLTGNFDLDFFGGNAYVSANPGANHDPFVADNKLYLLDTSGSNNHDVLANVGGYSAGLGVDDSGNVYYGTYYLGASDDKMLRFSASDIASAIGPGSLTVADAEELFTMPGGGYDLDVDDGGNIVFDINSGAAKQVSVWVPSEEGGGELIPVATPDEGTAWLTLTDVLGDATVPGGKIMGMDWHESGIFEIIKLIPGDANGDGTVDENDAGILSDNWQEPGDMRWANGDFNGDGTVGATDASLMAANWGQSLWTNEESTPTPEPGAVALLFGTVLGLSMVSRCRNGVNR